MHEPSLAPSLPVGEFHGVRSAGRVLASMALVETEYAGAMEVPLHSHEAPYLCVVVRGTFEERAGRHTTTHTPESVIYHPAGERHADRFLPGGGRCFNVQFVASALGGQAAIAWPEEPLTFSHSPINRLGQRLYTEFARTPDVDDAGGRLVLEGLALAMAGEVLRGGPSYEATPGYLRRAKALLHDRFREGISLDEVAAEADVHPTHLARMFRRHLRCSVGEYVRRLRVEWGARQLQSTESTISQIAAEAGFADHSHFSRTFRRYTGCTPSQYRTTRVR